MLVVCLQSIFSSSSAQINILCSYWFVVVVGLSRRDPKVRHNGRPSHHFGVPVCSNGVRALVPVLSVVLVELLRVFVGEVSVGKKLLVVVTPVNWRSLLVKDGRPRGFRLVCVADRNSVRWFGMCVIGRLAFCFF